MAAVSPILPPSVPQCPYATSCHKLACTRPPHPSPHPLSLTASGLDALDDPHGTKGPSILGRPPQRHRRAHVRTTQLAGGPVELRWPRNRSAVLATEGQRWADGEGGFRVNSPLRGTLG